MKLFLGFIVLVPLAVGLFSSPNGSRHSAGKGLLQAAASTVGDSQYDLLSVICCYLDNIFQGNPKALTIRLRVSAERRKIAGHDSET